MIINTYHVPSKTHIFRPPPAFWTKMLLEVYQKKKDIKYCTRVRWIDTGYEQYLSFPYHSLCITKGHTHVHLHNLILL